MSTLAQIKEGIHHFFLKKHSLSEKELNLAVLRYSLRLLIRALKQKNSTTIVVFVQRQEYLFL